MSMQSRYEEQEENERRERTQKLAEVLDKVGEMADRLTVTMPAFPTNFNGLPPREPIVNWEVSTSVGIKVGEIMKLLDFMPIGLAISVLDIVRCHVIACQHESYMSNESGNR